MGKTVPEFSVSLMGLNKVPYVCMELNRRTQERILEVPVKKETAGEWAEVSRRSLHPEPLCFSLFSGGRVQL